MKTLTIFSAALVAMSLASAPAMANGGYSSVLETMAKNDSFAGSANDGTTINHTNTTAGGVIVEKVGTTPKPHAIVDVDAGSKTFNVGVSNDGNISNEDLVDAKRVGAARVGYSGVKGKVETDAKNTSTVTATGDNSVVGNLSGIREDASVSVMDTQRGPRANVSASVRSGNVASGHSKGQNLSTVDVKQESSQKVSVSVRRTQGDL